MTELGQSEFDQVRELMLGQLGGELRGLMFELPVGLYTPGSLPEAEKAARAAGWITDDHLELTTLGWHVADPVREYMYWCKRS